MLDERLDEFEIKSYGVAMTTLEEVFLNINDELSNEKEQQEQGKLGNVNFSSDGRQSNSNTGSAVEQQNSMSSEGSSFEVDKGSDGEEDDEFLVRGSGCCVTVEASSAKRWNIYRRDYCGFICQVISPLILIVFGLLLTTGPSSLSQSPPRFLSTALYPQ